MNENGQKMLFLCTVQVLRIKLFSDKKLPKSHTGSTQDANHQLQHFQSGQRIQNPQRSTDVTLDERFVRAPVAKNPNGTKTKVENNQDD